MEYSRRFFKKTYLQPRIKSRVENDEFAEIQKKMQALVEIRLQQELEICRNCEQRKAGIPGRCWKKRNVCPYVRISNAET